MVGEIDASKLLSFIFGIIFLFTMLVLSVFVPNPTDLQIRVFITILSLAAAGVAAMIPGAMNLKVGKLVRGSGAIAVGCLVYLSEPAITPRIIDFPEPRGTAEPISRDFLRLLDDGDASGAWRALDPAGQRRVERGENGFLELYKNVRVSMGSAIARQIVNTETYTNPSGYPAGLYRLIAFRTKFGADVGCRSEVVGLRAINDATWAVMSYVVSLEKIPCE